MASISGGKKKMHKNKKTNNKKWSQSLWLTVLLSFVVPLITTITLEWIARGTLGPHEKGNGFFQAVNQHLLSFLISYWLLVFVYVFVSQLTGLHALATGVVGLIGNVPAIVTYYKLTMRGEPFLPWDLTQIKDLMGVSGSIKLDIQPSMIISAIIFVMLIVGTAFVSVPSYKQKTKAARIKRFGSAAAALLCALGLMFGIFLSPKGTAAMRIKEDMWMQDRYYRTNGVITGFLTNLQMLRIKQPDGYSKELVLALAEETQKKPQIPYYKNSYANAVANPVQQPDIIFVMGESFWDVTALKGIEYDQEILPNISALKEEAASGMVYTPSFGGGTCDVEFEALTAFSVENLPSGSKPYQQYVTSDMFSLPQYLKSQGYQTLAIHGYGRKFWNRDTAYPRLGIDTFIASDDFVKPIIRRGFISDEAMVNRIIEEQQARENNKPVFIHAVTMQNHTTYSPERYPADDLVGITNYPSSMSKSTIGQLQDCATGIREMDAAIGKLTTYLRSIDRPTILVFWGDHLNPMSDGFKMFEQTGFIANGETDSPKLRETPLLIWSNYADNKVELGTVASYALSPVMMDLYGIEMPLMFKYVMEEMRLVRARTRGVTINLDGTYSEELTEVQQQAVNKHAILQYDFMFGDGNLETYVQGG